MKISEIQNKSQKELKKLLGDKKESIRKERFNISGGNKNTKSMRDDRKDVARIMTILNKKK